MDANDVFDLPGVPDGHMVGFSTEGCDPFNIASPAVLAELEACQALGKKSWLIVTFDVVHYDPPRGPDGRGLNAIKGKAENTKRDTPRLRMMVDGGVCLDADVLGDKHLRVISTRLNRGDYIEDKPFANKWYEPGKIVTWTKFKRSVEAYVEMSNMRAQFHLHSRIDGPTLTYNPVKNQIHVRGPKYRPRKKVG